jgi:hypothetical protein
VDRSRMLPDVQLTVQHVRICMISSRQSMISSILRLQRLVRLRQQEHFHFLANVG